ncbi:D-alanine--D-alanine ligase [Gammaproteobacteria bacterium]
MKLRVAVIFGGRSPEHDVSVVTGLQVFAAIDQSRFDPFPVYISPEGTWWIGDALIRREIYLIKNYTALNLSAVTFDVNSSHDGLGRLIYKNRKIIHFGPVAREFDVAVIAMHGLAGEDGRLQALFEIANVPYTGIRSPECAILMDKAATKTALSSCGIAVLPHVVLGKPNQNSLIYSVNDLKSRINIPLPVIVKPLHLGSSIGVAKAESYEEISASLANIFRLDAKAIIEPFVPNLVEYNIAVHDFGRGLSLSAIECPKRTEELLDFRTKYLPNGGAKNGIKQAGSNSQGMLSLTRTINPIIPEHLQRKISEWSTICYMELCNAGSPRIDFLCNSETEELWLNEVNPCPGSFAYFLWEAARPGILFSNLVSQLIEQGLSLHKKAYLPGDLTPPDARLFSRP